MPRVKVWADGDGVVSHAGMGLLRELADLTGLSGLVTAVLADTYKGPWTSARQPNAPNPTKPAPTSTPIAAHNPHLARMKNRGQA